LIRRLPLILVCAAMVAVGFGCGSDDSDDEAATPRPCEGAPPTAPPGSDADAAREAVVAYFLTCDPVACTEAVTKRHIQADYGGSIARCEEVRSNNKLTRRDFTLAGDPQVDGDEAEVGGQVKVTGETFVVELKLVGGAWKIDRLRDTQ
jgi:hypothetical protein